ncbi:MAG: hypothetical protein A2599_00705 [Candidatus Staskawiczbacteria bacterium RIFOXYD1_FULL_39_28]|uniref:Prepilin-type N-terminal cleavage/methylation domain-containing protein n=1 Tax=Candidatus Staskawiczbacteria bacterium RIFOXYC1_FULL_38_18 TaxID=1802229 RepID=A0A1G2JEC3_9BACT|nr:MAG: hypothetical protein A2401_03155 [Candidatus Staskawiczbacteria bacterium RIFOXYC1_FULL_38_18]OGZ90674.1 MAG: hypothetical protein A2599_00705 [Candidatus Staskawiczbacteria bacterium RIFOXYD1_FULL_39_28]
MGNNKGFTIIEIIVAISILAGLLLLAAPLLISLFQNPKQELAAMDSIDRARIAASNFTNEIRNATTGSDGSYPLKIASESEIIFYSNFGSVAPLVNRIRYFFSEGTLYKGIIVPSGNPLAYDPSSEGVGTVISGLEIAPTFSYYDGDYNGSTASLAQPVSVTQIKFVKINLPVPKKTTAQSTDTFLVSAGGSVRALKDNLGN